MPRKIRELSGARGQTSHRAVNVMKESTCYVKIVEWSDDDGCYVGSAPGLLYGGCHGDDERQVFAELYEIVDETIALYHQGGKPLPPPTAGQDIANKLQSSLSS